MCADTTKSILASQIVRRMRMILDEQNVELHQMNADCVT